ncbi:MAG: beta-lactamase family protein [Lentisphaeria bacterium]|nr:beta-lactamase family protein [Lentisphaeria bacterium]
MKIKLLLCIVTAAVLSCVQARESGTHYAADVLNPYVESGELPGAISILVKGDVQETACVGWADVEKKIPMSLDKMFMQCSQTKGFCGVTVAMLVEEGKISLDDPVSKYLPEFQKLMVRGKGADGKAVLTPAKNVLTIRMVMNHTGGFPFETPTKTKLGWNRVSLRDTAREAAANPIRFEPGTKVLYSNTGIDIGAAVVEVVTGKPWEVFLKERVLDPLGMKDTVFNPTDEQLSRTISLYDVKAGEKAKFRAFNKWMPLPHNGPQIHPSAGAGLWTTAQDQLKFYKMLMNYGMGENGVRILKEETVKNLLATSTRPAGLGNYSLGLSASRDGSSLGHGGAWRTNCQVDCKNKRLRLWVVQYTGSLTTNGFRLFLPRPLCFSC